MKGENKNILNIEALEAPAVEQDKQSSQLRKRKSKDVMFAYFAKEIAFKNTSFEKELWRREKIVRPAYFDSPHPITTHPMQ